MRGMDVRLVGAFFFLGFAFALVGFFAGFFLPSLALVLVVVVAGRETRVLGKKERVWFRMGREDAKRERVSEGAATVGRRGEEMRTARRRRVRWEITDIVKRREPTVFRFTYDEVDWSCLAAASNSPFTFHHGVLPESAPAPGTTLPPTGAAPDISPRISQV